MKSPMIACVALALISSLITWWPRSVEKTTRTEALSEFLTQSGKQVDPEGVASLRVASWVQSENLAKVFEVTKRDGVWIIPSQYDYPADGGRRVGETAGKVLNIRRISQVAKEATKHVDLGVVDPLQPGTANAEGRGKRITLKDHTGGVLVDLIVGKKAEGTRAMVGREEGQKREAEMSYVREAYSDTVYTALIDLEVSTSFKDWVETGLLKVPSADVVSVRIADYSVQDKDGQRTCVERAASEFSRQGAAEWTSASAPAGKIVNQETLNKILDEVNSLKLSGVRPFNPAWLEARGIYLGPKNQLYGSEGVLQLGAKDGVRYLLYFGGIALSDEQDTSAELKEKQKTGQNRYMAVFTYYDPAIDASETPAAGKEAGQEPKKDPNKKAAGAARAEKAQRRFAKFFYVISDESFKKLRPALETLFKEPEKPKVDESKTDEPKVGVPKLELPKLNIPKVITPKLDDPKAAQPKVEAKPESTVPQGAPPVGPKQPETAPAQDNKVQEPAGEKKPEDTKTDTAAPAQPQMR